MPLPDRGRPEIGATDKTLSYLIHHVFLPPKLPQEDDYKPANEEVIVRSVVESLKQLQQLVPEYESLIQPAITTVKNIQTVHEKSGNSFVISGAGVKNAIQHLCERGAEERGIIPLSIRAQNAGVLISKFKNFIHFEVFELSPLNEAIIKTKGRLRRQFPASAVAIDLSTVQPEFQTELADTLAKLSLQPACGTQPTVRKASQQHEEYRDTAHPKMVTEFLVALLLSLGKFVKVSSLCKNTREEVLWRNSFLPWRRSPMWLLIRVSLQLGLSRLTSRENQQGDVYKEFMLLFMSGILHKAWKCKIDSAMLSAMSAKVSRRLRKLHPTPSASVLDLVQERLKNTNNMLQERWTWIQKNESASLPLASLRGQNFEKDTLMHLGSLDKYIDSITRRQRIESSASFLPTGVIAKYEPDTLPEAMPSPDSDLFMFSLAAFEDWVANSLGSWLVAHLGEEYICGRLHFLLTSYYNTAACTYSTNPEATSVMVLVILELWVACDKAVVAVCPLLRDYDHGIPLDLLQNLILPFKSQGERLHHVEEYLSRRSDDTKFTADDIFINLGSQDSFAVKYFLQSGVHKELLERIEHKATEEREAKRDELRRKKADYDDLLNRFNNSVCLFDDSPDEDDGTWSSGHISPCYHCQSGERAQELSISVHEWPLSDDPLKARATVFELAVPSVFGHWRDATIILLLDVLKLEYTERVDTNYTYSPSNDRGLMACFQPYRYAPRICLLSDTKPHVVTHRKDKLIASTNEDQVCLKNGLQYQYHDSKTGSFVRSLVTTDKFPRSCMYGLPSRSVALQEFVFRPSSDPCGPPPNKVISTQSQCPDHISLDEYKALCSIPLGYRIQWHNILVQLFAPSVDFSKPETGLVILQCIHQAGVRCQASGTSGARREGHVELDDDKFSNAILDGLHDASQRLKENWQSFGAFSTFIAIARRLVSLTTQPAVKLRCMEYLDTARNVTFGWVYRLKAKARLATDENGRAESRSQAATAALVCASSFSLEEGLLNEALVSRWAMSIFLQCCMTIQEGALSSSPSDPWIALLYFQWQRICHRCYRALSHKIVGDGIHALDDAVLESWSAYEGQGGWQKLSDKFDHWLVNDTPECGDRDPAHVSFCLLTGELLVNGVPVDHLPLEYERHPDYQRLFGCSRLEVMPAHISGMRFSGRNEFMGHTLYFGLSPSSDPSCRPALLIRATKEISPTESAHTKKDIRAYEVIPPDVLKGCLPAAFVEDYVHWYDMSAHCVEFRPIGDAWNSSSDHWRLSRDRLAGRWRVEKSGSVLLDIQGASARVVATIFGPLADPRYIHTTLVRSESVLNVELPRLKLSFWFEAGSTSIHSRQFRTMHISQDQSIKTLVGLRNKLVLEEENAVRRVVIIPEGPVSYSKVYEHVYVEIDQGLTTTTHSYYVDGQLGKLRDNGSLQSKFLLCYLHALTSFCLPDPFTMRTGTEEALLISNSASVKSFPTLSQDNIDLLGRIALLTPGRSYYPPHERVMQTVEWSSDLSFLSQHSGFYLAVRGIFDQHATRKFFYPESYLEPPPLDHTDDHLLTRDDIRSSIFRVSGFGAESHTDQQDVVYKTRDRGQQSAQASRAFSVASAIVHEQYTPSCSLPDNLESYIWHYLKDSAELLGADHTLPFAFAYDTCWLQDTKESKLIRKYWIPLHQAISTRNINKFKLMIWLSTLAFAEDAKIPVILTLASFFTVHTMARVALPQVQSAKPGMGLGASYPILHDEILQACLPRHRCPEAEFDPPWDWRSWRQKLQYQERKYSENRNAATGALTSALLNQWPCETPFCPEESTDSIWGKYFEIDSVMQKVRTLFKTWYDNGLIYEYLRHVSTAMPNEVTVPSMPPSMPPVAEYHLSSRKPGFASVNDLFLKPAPEIVCFRPANLRNLIFRSPSNEQQAAEVTVEVIAKLTALISRLGSEATSTYQKRYVKGLQDSLQTLKTRAKDPCLVSAGAVLLEWLRNHLKLCESRVQSLFAAMLGATVGIRQSLAQAPTRWHDDVPDILHQPRLSPVLFLQCLSRDCWHTLSAGWKAYLVEYGIALTRLQQAERMLGWHGNKANLINEIQNPGHTNWDPHDYPESLLLEIESGMMIRAVQEQVANPMRCPPSGRNAVMQLNMGEGKSSVIAPIVAASLADGKRLVRVIVAKPQARQMFEMLVDRLGGLLGRPVFHMPVSRSVRLTEAQAQTLYETLERCRQVGGVLLMQPEHILSLKLMALEASLMKKDAVSHAIHRSLELMRTQSRDIVDESDENFSVKFELVYTVGTQRPTDHSPQRWNCAHEVLDILRKVVSQVKKEMPETIEIYSGPAGCFPRTRILKKRAEKEIVARVAMEICDVGLTGFSIARQSKSIRQAVRRYISVYGLEAADIEQVEDQGFWSELTSDFILLLRGLLAGGVLAHSFGQKRWRVDYGLDSSRKPETKLAIPYRAKDSPSARSEFSHPDVVIILTTLSYYYGGLQDRDLLLSFNHLVRSSQADLEYQLWVKDVPDIPTGFRQLVGINLADKEQCKTELFPFLRFSKGAVDYFLAHIVFPKEMREFPDKLSASGWDLSEVKANPTTGFSGTNDSRELLPLGIKQIDLPELKHTNALVLSYILQPENTVSVMRSSDETAVSDAERLLTLVVGMRPQTRVILDVGAQVLELDNIGLARAWLKLVPDNELTQGVVFFGNDDHIYVLDRKETVEPLSISPFATQLDVCLVFLDEAHTRGTDLKLPAYYRAAVTLGANLTKDRLVQACMRMRGLGKGQSVVFCVPEEIKNKILARAQDPGSSDIRVSDILAWVVSETWADTERSMPLWAIQGWRYRRHEGLRARTKSGVVPFELATEFLEEEAQSLKKRYRPQPTITTNASVHPMPTASERHDDPIWKRCDEFDALNRLSASLHEEQERELSPEVEKERQIEKPEPAMPAEHRIHEDIRTFITTGQLPDESRACMPAFQALSDTSAADHLDLQSWRTGLLVTVDFKRTVESQGNSYVSDSYQRSVQWVLTGRHGRGSKGKVVRHMIIISPFEAQDLLPHIKKSKAVVLHLYSPRPGPGYRNLDSLDLFTVPNVDQAVIPRALVVELNLFAGQLYAKSFQEYTEICDFIGIPWQNVEDGEASDQKTKGLATSAFISLKGSPVKFLQALMVKIRRNCEGIDKTHMGFILDNRLMTPAHFTDDVCKVTSDDEKKR